MFRIMSEAVAAAATAAPASPGGMDAGDIVALAAVIVAFIIGVTTMVVTVRTATRNITAQQNEKRRQERALAYAEAIRAVEDYLEAPYRIRRRDGSSAVRWQLTESISQIQSRINLHKDWLAINASKDVFDAYLTFVHAAKAEAGAQMTIAWNQPVTKKDRQVPLGVALHQPKSAEAREAVLKAMKDCTKQ
jgi:hypothetical protein